MIVYQVAAKIDPDLVERFEQYMREKHIADVLATGAFLGASFESSGVGRYRTRYMAETQDALDNYLTDFAPRLRDDVVANFPTGTEFSREFWVVLEMFA
jgi:hypothetical protein